ncbi:GHMP family kinase ATP-binding protein [Bacillus weihaiensis]|uniref:GHMP family kinase ATP-binding protein n=1 Tax=Bacillus weihaiensis TaxID=1547283 RepID=UPI0023540601|nr:hypothetical protein [Bacillus weihaiensis]
MAIKKTSAHYGKGSCNGTFGELVQGIKDNQPFLITFPIAELRSIALFTPDNECGIVFETLAHQKAALACNKLLAYFNQKGGGRLRLLSTIPKGKGMASSSADIVAAMKAVANCFSLPLTKELISQIACEIEPTDGVMYRDIVAYDYINGQLIEELGQLPPWQLIGFDLGGTVDTLGYNQQEKNYTLTQLNELKQAYQLVKEGIIQQHLGSILCASTISTRINQHMCEKPYFEEFEKLSACLGGGLLTAHSGTMLGILKNPAFDTKEQIYQEEILLDFNRRTGLSPIFYTNVNQLSQPLPSL